MPHRSVAEWLHWQASLHPQTVDLGLDRVRNVLARLGVTPPRGQVLTVAGTNGKGSTVTLLQDLLIACGRRPGLYTSPHLVNYNERIRIAGAVVSDEQLIRAFERVEQVRSGDPLTFFEFGTLAALACFAEAGCDSWVLEVGLGGRLDAVNAVEPDVALITTVALDHQDLLGDTVPAIAREKAGILRPGRPALYGDAPVPETIVQRAREIGANLELLDRDFSYVRQTDGPTWRWAHAGKVVEGLLAPAHWTEAQYRNASLVLAALARLAQPPSLPVNVLNRVLADSRPDGRFQIVQRRHQWVLDVAHNPQAAGVLRAQLGTLQPVPETTVVVALLADKAVTPFARELSPVATRWIVAGVDDPRASTAERMLRDLAEAHLSAMEAVGTPSAAFELAERVTRPGGRIVVCGSFRVVGPALQWLGLY